MEQHTSSDTDQNQWKRCSSCKKSISFGEPYQVCSVSTCRGSRKGLVFCSVACWDSHLGFANHRESWAEERRAPSKEEYSREQDSSENQPAAKKRIIRQPSAPLKQESSKYKGDTLVVVSKVKKFIQEQSGYNTSQCGIDALTKKVAEECLKAIEKARLAERKTVMGRDIE